MKQQITPYQIHHIWLENGIAPEIAHFGAH